MIKRYMRSSAVKTCLKCISFADKDQSIKRGTHSEVVNPGGDTTTISPPRFTTNLGDFKV